MKIALCICGQPRMWKEGFIYHFNNIIRYNDVKVFIHTWTKYESKMNEIIELYRPKTFLTDKYPEVDLSKYKNTPDPRSGWFQNDGRYSTYCQLFAIYRCIQAKKIFETHTKQRFDWVIRSRFDFAINVRIPFERLDSEFLYIPNCRTTPARDFGNDQFAFSSSQNMDKYAETYNHINEFYDSGVTYIMEDFMSANWKRYGLVGDKLIYCDINHPFPPGKYNSTWHSLIRDDIEQWKN